MPRRAAALAVLCAAVGLAGCGNDNQPLPAVCSEGPRPVTRALGAAPGPVRLDGGVRLSTCLERASSDADIQTMGFVLIRAADDLATRADHDDQSATELGYLIGAVRRGAAHTSGIHEEIVRRVAQSAGPSGAPAAHGPAFRQGLAAGGRTG